MASKTSGIVAEFLANEFGGLFQATESTLSIGSSSQQVAANDSERVFILMANIGIELVTIQINRNAASNEGFLLPPNGGLLAFNLKEDFVMPSYLFNAISSGLGSSLTVIEVRRVAAQQPMEVEDAV